MYIKGKGHFESDGKTKIGSDRKVRLAIARRCGFENDSATFTRLLIESRISQQTLREQWKLGAQARLNHTT